MSILILTLSRTQILAFCISININSSTTHIPPTLTPLILTAILLRLAASHNYHRRFPHIDIISNNVLHLSTIQPPEHDTNSIDPANSCLSSNQKRFNPGRNSRQLDLIPSQKNPIKDLPHYFFKNRFHLEVRHPRCVVE